jgi:hypothetical protein
MPTFKWLVLNNLRFKTLGQIQNLDPHRRMSRLKSKTTPGDTLRTRPYSYRRLDPEDGYEWDGGRQEFGLRGQRRGTESIVAEMVERRERMGVIAWFCCRWEQSEARTHQKTARNNAFEQRTGLVRVGGKLTSQPNSHFWLRCASFSGVTEINRQQSGEERLKH